METAKYINEKYGYLTPPVIGQNDQKSTIMANDTGKADEGLEAVGFAEWIQDNAEMITGNKWRFWDVNIQEWVRYTTTELYNLYRSVK